MKKILFFLFLLSVVVPSNAQTDSLAIATINKLGVYYLDNGSIKKIEPIMYIGIKAGGFMAVKAKMQYDGENSQNTVQEQVFYIYIPAVMQGAYSLTNFKLLELNAKKGKREVTTVSAAPFYAKTGTENSVMQSEKLTEELVKLVPSTKIVPGHYGIFYDYAGGIPTKLYDFDVK